MNLQEKVQEQVQLLDQEMPDWWKNWDTVDIEQFTTDMQPLYPLPNDQPQWKTLNGLWSQEIEKRKKQ